MQIPDSSRVEDCPHYVHCDGEHDLLDTSHCLCQSRGKGRYGRCDYWLTWERPTIQYCPRLPKHRDSVINEPSDACSKYLTTMPTELKLGQWWTCTKCGWENYIGVPTAVALEKRRR